MEGGDRGHVAVNVPSPVVPYVPNHLPQPGFKRNIVSDSSIWQKFQESSRLRVSHPNTQNSIIKENSNDLEKSSFNPSSGGGNTGNPYTSPTLYNEYNEQPTTPQNYIISGQKATFNKASGQSSAADFSSFEQTNKGPMLKVQGDDYSYDEGYQETDRIDVPSLMDTYIASPRPVKNTIAIGSIGGPEYLNSNSGNNRRTSSIKTRIDPTALIYSSKTAPYGQQFPSYVPHSIETLVGSTLNTEKQLSAGNNIVYGRGKIDKSDDINQVEDEKIDYDYDPPNSSNNIRNIFAKKNSFEHELEDEYYDDYSEYDDEYSDLESSGDYGEIYDDKYLESLNKKLKLVDEILNESSSDNLSKSGKDDLLPDLVKLWQQTMKREPKTDVNG